MKKIMLWILSLMMILSGCGNKKDEAIHPSLTKDGIQIELSDDEIIVEGELISDDTSQAIYCANDIVYYEANKDFTYGEGSEKDAHEESEALKHRVVHIAQPGTYEISGTFSQGQIAIDLGDDAKDNESAVVNLILNNVDITCDVAPAIIFYNVYECGNRSEENATKDVDTSKAGANVIIADDSINQVNGSYVAKIYKSYELNEEGTEVVDSKKLHKYDAAFYSKMSMNVNGGEKGNGILNIKAENEGLDSELHLTINGGVINITSGNDGINTNEDNISVTTLNGGSLNIKCDGSTGEGDGIDSNGWLVINGGTLNAQACATSGDAGIDSDKGIYINGGTICATGNMLDHIAGGSQTYVVFQFANRQKGNQTYTLKDKDDKVVASYTPENDFTYMIIAGDDLIEGEYTFYQGEQQLVASAGMQGGMMPGMQPGGFEQGERPEPPNGMEHPEGFEQGERPEPPNGMEHPEGFEPSNGIEPPQGFEPPEGFEPPQGMEPGRRPEQGMQSPAELSPIFKIIAGQNQFSFVSVKE